MSNGNVYYLNTSSGYSTGLARLGSSWRTRHILLRILIIIIIHYYIIITNEILTLTGCLLGHPKKAGLLAWREECKKINDSLAMWTWCGNDNNNKWRHQWPAAEQIVCWSMQLRLAPQQIIDSITKDPRMSQTRITEWYVEFFLPHLDVMHQ